MKTSMCWMQVMTRALGRRVLCILAVATAWAGTPAVARADTPYDYMSQALSKVVAASALMNLADFDYYQSGSSIFGAYLPEGKQQGLRTPLNESREYIIIAAGDEDIRDLDLVLEDEDGNVVQSDVERDATPIVRFTPAKTGMYTINMKNVDSVRASFCAMVILEKSSKGDFDLSLVVEALQNCLEAARTGGLFASGFAEDCFCLFGGKLAEGRSNQLYDISSQSGKYLLVGAGSDNVADADLSVVRQHRHRATAGEQICSDTETDNTPVCIFDMESGRYYLVEYKNYDSANGKPGFVFAALLKMPR